MKTPALAFLLATIIGSTRGILQDSSTGTSSDSTTDTSADAKVNALDNTGVHSSAHPNLRSKSVKREYVSLDMNRGSMIDIVNMCLTLCVRISYFRLD